MAADIKTRPRVAMLFPYAPVYRERIYRMMDAEFDITWFFAGNAVRNLRQLDYSMLRNVDFSMQEHTLPGGIQYYSGLNKLHLEEFDVVITPTITRNLSTWPMMMCGIKGRRHPRLLVWTHGWYGRENRLQRFLKNVYYRGVDKFLLYGNYARNLMLGEGYRPEQLQVIYNSLDYDRQLPLRQNIKPSGIYSSHFSHPGHTLVFIGRLTEEKALDMILELQATLLNRATALNLAIVGDGAMRQSLEQLATRLGIADRVWFYGECFDEAVNAQLIYEADLCVSPGNIGLTAIHAMMFGTPCISHSDFSHQGPEFEAIRPGLTGDFFERGNRQSLIDAVENWFNRPGYDREEIRRACFNEIDTRWNPAVQMDLLKRLIYND